MSSIWTIRRSTSDAKLAGLCGGLARHWGVDPVLVRVGWAVLALSGGLGIVLYAAGWLLLPADGRDTAPVDDLFGASVRAWPRELWVAIVVVACVAGFAVFGWLAPFGIGPALVIALVWYFGFYRPRVAANAAATPPAPAPPAPIAPIAPFRYPGPPTPFTEAAESWQRRVAEYQAQPPTAPPVPPWTAPPGAPVPSPAPATVSAVAPVPGPPSPPVPADPDVLERAAFLATPDPAGLYVEPERTGSTVLVTARSRPAARRLRWATLLALGLAMAGLGIADRLGVDIAPVVYAAAALLVVGVALVLATWLGRAGGLLPVGTLLAAGVLGLSAASTGLPGPPDLGLPVSTVAYATPAEFPAGGDRRDIGTLTVDLRGLTLTEDATYQAGVDVGNVVVLVPPDRPVRVNYRLDVGSVVVFGRPAGNGPELSGGVSDSGGAPPGRPTLTLDLRVGAGSVEVRR